MKSTMKMIPVLGLALAISAHPSPAFANCVDQLRQKSDGNVVGGGATAGVGSMGVFAVAASATAPISLGIEAGVAGATGIVILVKSFKQKALIKLIDEARQYQVSSIPGARLLRAQRIIERSLNSSVAIDKIADGIVAADESESLCDAGSVRRFSKLIAASFEQP